MDLFYLNDNDFKEFFFDINSWKKVFNNKQSELESNTKLKRSKYGKYNIYTQKQGNVYLTNYNMNFTNNIVGKMNKGVENIALYFMKRSNTVDLIKNVKILNSSANVLFTHEDFKSCSLYKKDCNQEATSLHLPVAYFKEIAERYPERFESHFLRYEKGESFYLYENYVNASTKMYKALWQLENHQLMGNANSLYTDVKVLELLDLLFPISTNIVDYSKKHCKTQSDIEKIKEAAFILISDIHNPPSIKSLALKSGINEKKLKYGFKEVFSTTPYGYLFEYKMNLAQKYLLDTDKNISEIAILCGYTYPTHFCTAFKRRFGVSPSDSRKHL